MRQDDPIRSCSAADYSLFFFRNEARPQFHSDKRNYRVKVLRDRREQSSEGVGEGGKLSNLTFKLDQPERHCRLFPPEIPEWTPNNFTSETNRLITVQKTGLSKNYTSQLRLFPLRAGSHMSFHHAIIPHLLDYQEVVGAACWSGQRPAVQAPCERMTLINVLYIVSSNSALILRVQVV